MSNQDDPGMVDTLKGTAKEAAGRVLSDEDMEREGESDHERGQKADEAARHEEEAERKRAEQREKEGGPQSP